MQTCLLLPEDGEHPKGRGCLHSLEVAPNSRGPRRSSVEWTKGTDQGAHLSFSLVRADALDQKFPGLGMTGSQSVPMPGHSCQPRGLGSPQSESSHRQGLGEGRHPGLAAVQSCNKERGAARCMEGPAGARQCTRSEKQQKAKLREGWGPVGKRRGLLGKKGKLWAPSSPLSSGEALCIHPSHFDFTKPGLGERDSVFYKKETCGGRGG